MTPTVTGGWGGKGIWEREGRIAEAGYLHRQKWTEYGEQVKGMTFKWEHGRGRNNTWTHNVVRNQGQQVTVLMGGKCWSQGREEKV